MNAFENLKPKLKSCQVFDEGSKIMIEDTRTHEHVLLPASAKPLLRFFDGKHTIREIVSELHREHGKVEFRNLFTTVHRLSSGHLLDEEGGHEGSAVHLGRDPFEKGSFFLDRSLFRIGLSTRLSFPGLCGKTLFYFLFAMLLFTNIALWGSQAWSGFPNHFLRIGGSYGWGLLFFFGASAVLLSFRHLVSTALLLAATGRAYHPAIVLSPLGLHYQVGDGSIYVTRGKTIPILFHLATVLSYALVAGLSRWLLPHWEMYASVQTIAAFLLLLELNPYSRSELTKVFHVLYDEKLYSHLLPYLKNRALLSFVSRTETIIDELELFVYSTLAIVWCLSFLHFSTSLVGQNFPNLTLALQNGGIADRAGATVIFGGLLALSAYFIFDLFGTLIRNVAFPMSNHLLKASRRLSARSENGYDHAKLRGLMKSNPLFEDMSDEVLSFLLQEGAVRKFRRGTPLIIQNAHNGDMYFLVQGKVGIRKREPTGRSAFVCHLHEGAVFGEISVIRDHLATADVIAETEIIAFVVNRSTVRRIPEIKNGAVDFEKIVFKVMLGHYISSSPLFRDVPREVTSIFTSRGKPVNVKSGEVIAEQGSQEKSFYLLMRGKVEVLVNGHRVSEIGQGGFFGEIALISNVPRTASVRATEDCILVKLDGDTFWKILTENIGLSMFIETVAESRTREIGSAAMERKIA